MDDLDLGQTLTGFRVGQRVFGRYTLTRLLGRGGMGVVWLAHDEKLEQDVALKFLPEPVSNDLAAISDLKRETRRSLQLTHPHIVRIHDFVEDSRLAAVSMEFVDGASLTQRRLDQPGAGLRSDPAWAMDEAALRGLGVRAHQGPNRTPRSQAGKSDGGCAGRSEGC
jgi:serine/threonine protein kinase